MCFLSQLLELYWNVQNIPFDVVLGNTEKKARDRKTSGEKIVKQNDFLNSQLENFVHIVFFITQYISIYFARLKCMCVGDNLCVYQRGHKASVIRMEVYGGVELGVFTQYFLALCQCEGKKNKCNIEINKNGYWHKENCSI